VIEGKSLVTNKIQELMRKFSARMVPTDWLAFWEESADPYEWIRVFGKKILCLKDWVYKAQNSRLLGEVYDLAELFHPVVFLNACKQYVSRNKIALDKLSLVATFEEDRASENAIKLKNLLIQGCSLANFLLTEPSVKGGEF
jgi:hypothetical protein